MMKIVINASDFIFIAAGIWLTVVSSPYWIFLSIGIILGWFFNIKWSKKSGWSWFHEETK